MAVIATHGKHDVPADGPKPPERRKRIDFTAGTVVTSYDGRPSACKRLASDQLIDPKGDRFAGRTLCVLFDRDSRR